MGAPPVAEIAFEADESVESRQLWQPSTRGVARGERGFSAQKKRGS